MFYTHLKDYYFYDNKIIRKEFAAYSLWVIFCFSSGWKNFHLESDPWGETQESAIVERKQSDDINEASNLRSRGGAPGLG